MPVGTFFNYEKAYYRKHKKTEIPLYQPSITFQTKKENKKKKLS